jgi:hypothetical protein
MRLFYPWTCQLERVEDNKCQRPGQPNAIVDNAHVPCSALHFSSYRG